MDAHAPFLSFREVITKGLLFFSKNQPLVGVKQQAEGQKPIGELLRESVAGMSRFNARSTCSLSPMQEAGKECSLGKCITKQREGATGKILYLVL